MTQTACELASLIEEMIKKVHGPTTSVDITVASSILIYVRFCAMAGDNLTWLQTLVSNHTWHVSLDLSQGGKYDIAIEPKVQTPQLINGALYHATPILNIASIAEHGIVPSIASKTWTNRKYPCKRTFFAKSIWDTFVFISSHVTKKAVPGNLPDITDSDLNDWELLIISPLPFGSKFYQDAFFLSAVWTDSTIPSSEVFKVESWRERFHEAFAWDSLTKRSVSSPTI